MSAVMEVEIKRWTARRKSQLVLEIIQGRTSISEASRQFDFPPSEIESWVDEGKRGLENALRAKPEGVASSTSDSSKSCKRLTARRCWSCVREKNWRPCWARTRPDGFTPTGTASRSCAGLDGSVVSMIRTAAPYGVLQVGQVCAQGQS